MEWPVSGSSMVEDIAPERESSPHTNALTTSVLISWPTAQGVNAKTASRTAQPRLVIVLFMDRETLCPPLLVICVHYQAFTPGSANWQNDQYLRDLFLQCERPPRSEERRVGKECRFRWSPY